MPGTRHIKGYWRQRITIEAAKAWAILRKDKYDRLAAELRDVLLRGWDEATREFINFIIREIGSQEQLFDQANLDALIAQLRLRMGTALAGEAAQPLLTIQTASYTEGMSDIIEATPTFQVVDNRAVDMLQRHNVFWVGSYAGDNIGPEVTKLGNQIIADGLAREDAARLFSEAFEGKYGNKGMQYWRGFSNHVVTRSRELGRVEGYTRAGITYLKVKAVIDRRTTRICREMHNRVITVGKAVELRDQLLAAETPEDVKTIAPWMKFEQVEGKTSGSLGTGLSLPPFHFNCRTRTVKARKTDVERQQQHEADVRLLKKDKGIKAAIKKYRDLGIHKKEETLNSFEGGLVFHFSGNKSVNRALTAGDPGKLFSAYQRELNRSLGKLPSYKGVVSHSQKLDVFKGLAVGDEITMPFFLSGSASSEKAGSGNVGFAITSKRGKSISPYSKNGVNVKPDDDAGEVVFRNNSKFEVTGIKTVAGGNVIEMAEI